MKFQISTVAAIAAVCGAAAARPAPSGHVLHEERAPSTGWRKTMQMESTLRVPVRIGYGVDKLDRVAMYTDWHLQLDSEQP